MVNAGDLGSIPGSGRSPGEGVATPSSIFAWRIPWTEEPGRLQSMGLQSPICLSPIKSAGAPQRWRKSLWFELCNSWLQACEPGTQHMCGVSAGQSL